MSSPGGLTSMNQLLSENRIWLSRTLGVGVISEQDAKDEA
jgi:NADH:ubiquinone oxidoreductase subunit D